MQKSKSHAESDYLHITLVHGTWAHGMFRSCPKERSTSWYLSGSDFNNKLTDELHSRGIQTKIDSFIWSGKNSLKARLVGSNQLADYLNNCGESKHVVIAHSHGGNVAVKAISSCSDFKPLALFTLSTPFIVATPRKHSKLELWAIEAIKIILMVVPFMLALVGYVLFSMTIEHIFGFNLIDTPDKLGDLLGPIIGDILGGLFMFLFLLIPVLALFGGIYYSIGYGVKNIVNNQVKRVLSFSKDDIYFPAKIISIRAPRDEASTILSVAILVDSLFGLMKKIVNYPVSSIFRLMGRRNFARSQLLKRKAKSFDKYLLERWGIFSFAYSMLRWFFFFNVVVGTTLVAVSLSLSVIFPSFEYDIQGLSFWLLPALPLALVLVWILGLTAVVLVASSLSLSLVLIFYGIDYCLSSWSLHVTVESSPSNISCETIVVEPKRNEGLRHSIYNYENVVILLADKICQNISHSN